MLPEIVGLVDLQWLSLDGINNFGVFIIVNCKILLGYEPFLSRRWISFKRSNSILLIRRGCVTGNTLHLANNSFFSLYAEIGFPSRHLFDNVDGLCLGKIAIQLLILILLNVFAWILYYNGRRGS